MFIKVEIDELMSVEMSFEKEDISAMMRIMDDLGLVNHIRQQAMKNAQQAFQQQFQQHNQFQHPSFGGMNSMANPWNSQMRGFSSFNQNSFNQPFQRNPITGEIINPCGFQQPQQQAFQQQFQQPHVHQPFSWDLKESTKSTEDGLNTEHLHDTAVTPNYPNNEQPSSDGDEELKNEL